MTYTTVWTNNRVSLTKDLVFGLAVLTEEGWQALVHLSLEDVDMVIREVDGDKSCPFLDELPEVREAVRINNNA